MPPTPRRAEVHKLVGILHFLEDKDEPERIIATLLDALPPGSYLTASLDPRRALLARADSGRFIPGGLIRGWRVRPGGLVELTQACVDAGMPVFWTESGDEMTAGLVFRVERADEEIQAKL
jgi:hypothetical protein